MKYNINVIKSVWGRLRKPSRATLDAIFSQKAVYAEANGKTDAQRRRNPIPITFGWGSAFPFLTSPRGSRAHPPGDNYERKSKAGQLTHR
jgi:hypothetical protein